MKHLNSSAHPRQPANITSTQAPNLNKSQQISTNLNKSQLDNPTIPDPQLQLMRPRESSRYLSTLYRKIMRLPRSEHRGSSAGHTFPIYSIQFEEGLQSSPAIEEVREEKCDSSTQNHRGPFSKPWQVLFTGHGERQKSQVANPEPWTAQLRPTARLDGGHDGGKITDQIWSTNIKNRFEKGDMSILAPMG